MAAQPRLPSSRSNHVGADQLNPRWNPSASCVSLAFPQSATLNNLTNTAGVQRRSSRTWTTSSGELGFLSDTDEVNDRVIFVQEYNRLAKKHGVRLLVIEDFDNKKTGSEQHGERRGWFRRVFRSATNTHSPVDLQIHVPATVRHRRSISDLAYIIHGRREPPKIIDLQAMIRLSGKSALYLPPEYAPCSLVLPTCIRATAQFLAQNATTKGIFRIPGSVRIVNSLFEYYCYAENGANKIAGTVRCPTLPIHIEYSVHDIASTFKRLLSVLPGGVLGSLSLLDAFVAINSQLNGNPEFPRTKQTKVRARLIALAVGTISSQFRRELVCAVFGLLSLIGRMAELSPREDTEGRPLPTNDLMGYTALGIVFGPILVGDLLDQYTMRLAAPNAGMLLFPLSPQKRRRDRRKSKTAKPTLVEPPTVDKIHVANNITEMVIASWRDVVRQMRMLGTHHRRETSVVHGRRNETDPPGSSESSSVVLKVQQSLSAAQNKASSVISEKKDSPEPDNPISELNVRRTRPVRASRPHDLLFKSNRNTLGPVAQGPTQNEEIEKVKPLWGHDTVEQESHTSISTLGVEHTPKLSAENFEGSNDQRQSPSDVEKDQYQQAKHTNGGSKEHPISYQNTPVHASFRERDYGHPSGTFRAECHEIPPAVALHPEDHSEQRPPNNSAISGNNGAEKSRRITYSPRSATSTKEMPNANEDVFTMPTNTTGSQDKTDSVGRKHKTRTYSPDFRISNAKLPMAYYSKGKEADGSSNEKGNVQESWHQLVESDNNERGDRSHRTKLSRLDVVSSKGETPNLHYLPLEENQTYDAEQQEDPCNERYGFGPTSTPTIWNKKISDSQESPLAKQNSRLQKCLPEIKTSYGHWASCSKEPRESKSMNQIRSHYFRPHTPPITSSSASPNKRASVKAMAAMFENQRNVAKISPTPNFRSKEPTRHVFENAPSLPAFDTRLINEDGTDLPHRQVIKKKKNRSSSPRGAVHDTRDVSRYQLQDGTEHDISVLQKMANSNIEENRHRKPATLRANHRRSLPPLERTESKQLSEQSLRHATSLGTMTPYPQQPEVARRLNFRKQYHISPKSDSNDAQSPAVVASPYLQEGGSSTSLYTHVRNLQRRLAIQSQEMSLLKRQLQAQQEMDVTTVNELLRDARKDAATWEDRAKSAERRVAVFENFAKTMRSIKKKDLMLENSHPVRPAETNLSASRRPSDSAGARREKRHSGFGNQRVRFAEGENAISRDQLSDDSGAMEDAGVVKAHIRTCKHRVENYDGALESQALSALDETNDADHQLPGPDNCQVFEAVKGASTDAWQEVEELLRVLDDLDG